MAHVQSVTFRVLIPEDLASSGLSDIALMDFPSVVRLNMMWSIIVAVTATKKVATPFIGLIWNMTGLPKAQFSGRMML